VGYLGGPLAGSVFCVGPAWSDRVVPSVATAARIRIAPSNTPDTEAAECATFDTARGKRPVRPTLLPARPLFQRQISLPPESFVFRNQ
jgi:hypothetical protein